MNGGLYGRSAEQHTGSGIMPDALPEKGLKILFVCTGNTCRSPMAEAYINSFGASSGLFACSAGLYVSGERPISENAVYALKAEGIFPNALNPYEFHRSRQISRGMTDECDRIIGLTENHTALLVNRFPEAAGKLFTLPGVTLDPYGGTPETYIACLKQIIAGIRAVFPYLEK